MGWDLSPLIFVVCVVFHKYTYNGTYIYRLSNNLFIRTTCFNLNGSSSGAFSYTSLVIELQRNIRTFTHTYKVIISLFRPSVTILGMSLSGKVKLYWLYCHSFISAPDVEEWSEQIRRYSVRIWGLIWTRGRDTVLPASGSVANRGRSFSWLLHKKTVGTAHVKSGAGQSQSSRLHVLGNGRVNTFPQQRN
jgi:hypothetical protein